AVVVLAAEEALLADLVLREARLATLHDRRFRAYAAHLAEPNDAPEFGSRVALRVGGAGRALVFAVVQCRKAGLRQIRYLVFGDVRVAVGCLMAVDARFGALRVVGETSRVAVRDRAAHGDAVLPILLRVGAVAGVENR